MKITDIKTDTNYLNSFGMTLRRPLFETTSLCGRLTLFPPWTSTIERVLRYTATFFIALLSFIPCSALWFVGKGISHLGTPSINPEGLTLAPPDRPPPPRAAIRLNLNDLYTDYQAHIPARQRETFERACRLIEAEDAHELLPQNPPSREAFLGEMRLYLTHILTLLRDPTTPRNKREQALALLADGFLVCYPTWLEDAKRAYNLLSGREESAEELLLRHIQQDKEDLILDYAQNKMKVQWHALSYIRNLLSNQLGLARHFDPYIAQNDPIFGPKFSLWLFMQMYDDVGRLVTAIKNRIQAAGYEPKYASLLRDTVTQADPSIEDPTQYILDHYYEDDMQTLSNKGVIALLSIIGILH